MIYHDSVDGHDLWDEKAHKNYKGSTFEGLAELYPLNLQFVFKSLSDDFDFSPMDADFGFNDVDLDENSCPSPGTLDLSAANIYNPYGLPDSPSKLFPTFSDDYFLNAYKPDQEPVTNFPVVEKRHAPLSPDSGFEQDCVNTSLDGYANVFSLIDEDKDVGGMCEPIKLNTDTDIDKYLDSVINADKNSDTEDEIYNKGTLASVRLSDIIGSDCMLRDTSNKVNYSSQTPEEYLNGYGLTRNDSVASDHWINEALQSAPNDDFLALCAGLVLQPATKEFNELNIKEEDSSDKLFVLRNNSKTIQNEHSYHKKLCVVESDEEEEEEEPVKKRKRNEVDEDFSPYQKPKRKAGRPRTNFSKVNTQKNQRYKVQKTQPPKRTTQAPKKLKSCSTVPFDRRQQHNQAERERRDMLKKNLDIVEDATPDQVLHLCQLALQSEKANKFDEFENNENNFTVDVLKRLDDLVKKEPVNHKPKYKKASRNSKMVVLLGSTYYITSLDKELKAKESRLAQLKKQYEECLRRLNPSKASSKRVRRNY